MESAESEEDLILSLNQRAIEGAEEFFGYDLRPIYTRRQLADIPISGHYTIRGKQ